MTLFSALGRKRLALLTIVFVIGVACAKVDREYDDIPSAGSGGADASGGKGGSATGGSGNSGGRSSGGAESAGEGGTTGEAGTTGDAGSAGESSAGAAGGPDETFVPLTVTLAGNGSGSVKSVPAGINCGTTCSTQVPQGSSVQLTATPATGSQFAGWTGGGCTGTGVCTTTVSAAASVTATFTLATPTLTVTKTGTGLGTVSSTPTGINCGTTCSQVVSYGAVVTLNAAVSGTGSVFAGWSGGGCSGTGACVVTVTAATQVTATFTCSPGTTTIAYSGAITSFGVPSCVTSLTIDAYGASGGNGTTAFPGGLGARIKGTVPVAGGASLKVLVGGRGIDSLAGNTNSQPSGTGGGGTFVTTSTNSPLVVAGGGGGGCGHSNTSWAAAGRGGAITTAGVADTGNLCTPAINGAGGLTGTNSGGYHVGTGGGGLLGNGVNNSDGSTTSYGAAYTPGLSFISGGTPGQPGTGTCPTPPGLCVPGRAGGFGGGGAAGMTGGGGGGYSGGCAGTTSATVTVPATGGGGGGGSYNGGTVQTNTAAVWDGNGKVIFTW